MSKPREQILIIDDLLENIQVLATLLENDYEILFASSGKQGLELASREIPDLILLDVMMPEMDGFETCQRFKKDERLKNIPIIFVTALADEIDENHGLELGAVDYIPKPISPAVVKTRVKNILAFQKAQNELQKKNEELETFCLAVSHDLRAPLRTVKIVSQILSEEISAKINAEDLKNLERIIAGCNRMEELVSTLLRFSIISNRGLKKSSFNVGTIVEEIFKSLKDAEPLRSVDMKLVSDLEIDADIELMKVVMTNLISNAWKYSSKREQTIIEIGSVGLKEGKAYYVRDNGAGFDSKFGDKLFGAFERLHSRADFDGIGLGLFICKKIILKHGGIIWAEGHENAGATFFFTVS
ncbi:MAG: response regulator [Candidatus Riflebacteria bacterium]|nr:response regulator [Candidatus Riflebacteria bacterium]